MNDYLLTIKAEDRLGLLSLITGMMNRKRIPIESLTAAKTDISSIVIISLEIRSTEVAVRHLLSKIENIVEVYKAEAILAAEAISQRVAFFKMDKAFLESPQLSVVAKHNAVILSVQKETVLISKTGSDAILLKLYQQLEGPYLLGINQTGAIADSQLIGEDDPSVVIRLAA